MRCWGGGFSSPPEIHVRNNEKILALDPLDHDLVTVLPTGVWLTIVGANKLIVRQGSAKGKVAFFNTRRALEFGALTELPPLELLAEQAK